jgi:hypothetical protein
MFMDDNTDIAFLAASVERQMRQNLAGSSGLRHNRTDFRNFLNNGGNQRPNPPQYIGQQQYPPQYPPQYAPPQQYAPVDPNIPEGVIPPANPNLIPMPGGFSPPPQTPQYGMPAMESTSNFNIPDYNAKQKQYLDDEQQFRDALITEVKSLKSEIKSLKTSIKDLKKQVSALILSNQTILDRLSPPTTAALPDENPDQS